MAVQEGAETLAEQESLCVPSAHQSMAAALTVMWCCPCWVQLVPDKHLGVCMAEQERWHRKQSHGVSARALLPHGADHSVGLA